MASYFIKCKVTYSRARDIEYTRSIIIDFDKFEKVNSDSIYKKVEKTLGSWDSYKIDNIVKL